MVKVDEVIKKNGDEESHLNLNEDEVLVLKRLFTSVFFDLFSKSLSVKEKKALGSLHKKISSF